MITVMMKQGTKPIAHAQPVALASAPSRSIRIAAGIAQRARKMAANSPSTKAVSNSFNILVFSFKVSSLFVKHFCFVL